MKENAINQQEGNKLVQVTELNEKVPLFANFSISEQIYNLYNVTTNRMQMSIQVRKGYEFHDEHDEKKHFPVADSAADLLPGQRCNGGRKSCA